MQVTLQWTLLLAPLNYVVRLTTPKTMLEGRGVSAPSRCGECGGLYLLGSNSSSHSVLGVGIFWLLISFPLLFGGPGGISIISVTVFGSAAVGLLPTDGCFYLPHFGPMLGGNGDAVHDPERLVLGHSGILMLLDLF